ncbi:MFS transporter [Novosphingobium sp.]|uniref:MFS transporter n=1 Tax=Novosphingobium sp. TaxID=1874826 RepID=UPI003340F34C
METTGRSGGYRIALVLLLSLNFGILFFDRNALNFLMPYVRPDLGLNDTQVGMLSSGLSLTWAIAGFSVGRFSDWLGSRKPIIIIATLAFCVCSVVSGLAQSFLMLMGARILMGAAEGGVMPVSHSLIAAQVPENERGLAMGVAQNLGSNVLGSSVAPLVLVPVAIAFGWRHAFFIAAVPGLISAALLWFFLQEPAATAHHADAAPRTTLREAFADRNVQLCALISILLVSYLVCTWAFMPLYLTATRHVSADATKWLMATLGISAGIGSFAVTALSDRIGRRPAIIGFSFLGAILPLGALYLTGNAWLLAGIFFIGWGLNGVFPLFMATIPSESVDPRLTASLTGVVMGIGEVIGGVLSPALAGNLSDHFGRDAVMWLMLGLCITAGLVGLGLRETAPRVLARHTARRTVPV